MTSSNTQNSGKPIRLQKKGRRSDPTEGLQIVHPNAGAIDVGGSFHWAAAPPHRSSPCIRKIGCFTSDLEQMAKWFKNLGVDTVVMEATGNYWVSLYEILEAHGLKPVLVNARYAKNMQGRKTDILDCQWMQRLHSYGLFGRSFRPEASVRVLRAYLRQRESLVQGSSQSVQHMHKALIEMNIQLANVISDITGETGLAIIDAVLAGERDPVQLVKLKNNRIKASEESIIESLRGNWKEEQLFVLGQARATYSHHQSQIEECDRQVDQQIKLMIATVKRPEPEPQVKPTVKEYKLKTVRAGSQAARTQEMGNCLRRIMGVDLTRIDGVGPIGALTILSEIGWNMSAWPTEKHFSSWLALCPDHRISGGKILKRTTRPAVNRARNALRICASTLERSKSAMGAKFRRLKGRLGAPKAITAMAHHLARLIYRLLKHGQEFVDKGIEVYEAKMREQQLRWLTKKAAELNLRLIEAK